MVYDTYIVHVCAHICLTVSTTYECGPILLVLFDKEKLLECSADLDSASVQLVHLKGECERVQVGETVSFG